MHAVKRLGLADSRLVHQELESPDVPVLQEVEVGPKSHFTRCSRACRSLIAIA